MLTHVVLVETNPGTSDEQIAGVLDALATLPGSIPEIRSLTCGRDAGISETPVDLAVVVTFDSAEGYDAYRANPAHGAFARDHLRPVAASITISQFVSP